MAFFITGLGRCRTTWLSLFLSNGPVFCHHDLLREVLPSNLRQHMRAKAPPEAVEVGLADSGLGIVPELVAPMERVVMVHRPVDEVLNSMCRLGGDREVMRNVLANAERGMNAIRRNAETMDVLFEQLDEIDTVRAIWHFLVRAPWSNARWTLFTRTRVEPILDVDYFLPHAMGALAQRLTT